eukprot:SAG31_NODE_68_length_28153_cov_23.647717_29_plen_386_part_00
MLRSSGDARPGESIDERIERQRKERYESSDEFRAMVKYREEEEANIAISAKSQVSEADVSSLKAAGQSISCAQVAKWIADATGAPLLDCGDLHELAEQLKSGVVLCALVNALKPGSAKKVSQSKTPFPQRENIKKYIDGARALGVLDRENFEPNDLFEKSNLKQVLICLNALGRLSSNIEGYDGPCLKLGVTDSSGYRQSKRSDSKVSMLAVNLADKISVAKPPPAVGSLEWIKLQSSTPEPVAEFVPGMPPPGFVPTGKSAKFQSKHEETTAISSLVATMEEQYSGQNQIDNSMLKGRARKPRSSSRRFAGRHNATQSSGAPCAVKTVDVEHTIAQNDYDYIAKSTAIFDFGSEFQAVKTASKASCAAVSPALITFCACVLFVR